MTATLRRSVRTGTGACGEPPQIYPTGDDTAFPVNRGLAGGTYTPTGGSLTLFLSGMFMFCFGPRFAHHGYSQGCPL
jgi:hypothetical protein